MTVQTTDENTLPLVDRLRGFHVAGTISWEEGQALAKEAADEIERLEKALARERSYNPAHAISDAIKRFDAAKGK